jgi:hypothetical protein
VRKFGNTQNARSSALNGACWVDGEGFRASAGDVGEDFQEQNGFFAFQAAIGEEIRESRTLKDAPADASPRFFAGMVEEINPRNGKR